MGLLMDKERRVARAKELLDDPLITEILTSLEEKALAEMLRVPSWSWRSDDKRRRCADQINTIRALKANLLLIVQMGADRSKGGVA